MRKTVILRLEMPFREPLVVRAFEFGDADAPRSCAIVGSLRGDEIQPTFICANLVERLGRLEEQGRVPAGTRTLVIPCANPHSMNVASRFWPSDGSDVNRSFPGDPTGEATSQIAAGVMEAVGRTTYGIQLASFNQRGKFVPHVRVTRESDASEESLVMAHEFRLPYVVSRDPSPFDTSMLNYRWQANGTHAFSVYGRLTRRADAEDARIVGDAILRFMASKGLLEGSVGGGVKSVGIEEGGLVGVRTERAAGFLRTLVNPGDHVDNGQVLAEVLDTCDTHVAERLCSPVSGEVFFLRDEPLAQQRMVIAQLIPDRRGK